MCDFCRIVNGEMDIDLVYQDELITAFLDYEPINEGHVLIVPNTHVGSLIDVPDETIVRMMWLARKLIKRFEEIYRTDGYTLMNNGGSTGDLDHFHFHVFPRFEGDGFGWLDSGAEHDHSCRIVDLLREGL
ncbi:MAG: HIT family protein [Clostridia bacterium]|nr:HIT family protein [Clostridia bacterium]